MLADDAMDHVSESLQLCSSYILPHKDVKLGCGLYSFKTRGAEE